MALTVGGDGREIAGGISILEYAAQVDEYRRTLAQMFGGLTVLYGFYLTLRRVSALERSANAEEASQLSDAFTRAIDQLATEKPTAIRLGGVFSLARIAEDHPHEAKRVFDVLSRLVESESVQITGGSAAFLKLFPPQDDPPRDTTKVSAVVEACLQTLGSGHFRHIEGGGRVILKSRSLRGINLRGAQLDHANLSYCDLTDADLSRSNLSYANLIEVDLFGANLEEATLNYADLGYYVDPYSGGKYATNGSIITYARLNGAKFRGARLEMVQCQEVPMYTNASNADFSGANLCRASFDRCILNHASFRDANLWQTSFHVCYLRGADFSGANLDGAHDSMYDFKEARNVSREQLLTASISEDTRKALQDIDA